MMSLLHVLGLNPDRDDEQACIDQISLDQVLDQLPEKERELICLQAAYRCPEGYPEDWPWPPTLEDIAEYIGRRDGHAPWTVRTLHRHTKEAFRMAAAIAKGSSAPPHSGVSHR